MNDHILQSIIKEKKPCYFISPHFDDAVLSAGSLIRYLSQHVPVVVVTLFTQPEKRPYTLSARQYLRQCGYADAHKLFDDREKEDAEVLDALGVRSINLGYTDALWRKKMHTSFFAHRFRKIAELQVVYPTYRFHIVKGKIASEDQKMLKQIEHDLKKIVKKKNAVVFCPLGAGTHIDHVITKTACSNQFSPIYWLDFPYQPKAQDFAQVTEAFTFDKDLAKKETLVAGYKTQYQALFPNGFIPVPEKFFIRTSE